MKLQALKNEILSLRGANVLIFGQKTTMPASAELDEIDIIDIIDRLIPYEVEDTDSIDEFLGRLDEIYSLREIEHNNSYNWLSRVSNHFDYTVYECGDGYTYVVFKVHKYGDVRANYTEEALLKFNGSHEFYEVISECDKYLTDIHPDYEVKVSALQNMMEVYDNEGNYVCEISDLDELDSLKDGYRWKN